MFSYHNFLKRKASGILLIAVSTSVLIALLSIGMTRIKQTNFLEYSSSKIVMQAQQYAEAEAGIVISTPYVNLSDKDKTIIQNSNGYSSEIEVSGESNYTDSIKQRTVTISIYKDNEFFPRYSMNIVRTNVESDVPSGGFPIGAVVAWYVNTLPTSGGVWLECNGQSCSAYPALVAVLGKSTVPDYRNKFLEGHTTAGTSISAGLPNVTGVFPNGSKYESLVPTGPFYFTEPTTDHAKDKHMYPNAIGFDLSIANNIYGNSDTVQPPAVTVKYIIKAS